ncbi:hypothetical protein GBAR_LOCUS2120 [Geodia barretti]|uniref:Fibronectin type-III domain-containing protein n=1 Tax=Geodia barretti TaxID=519541 RepID=A0AA35QZH1_GEOBA|nr:hypothetical protein GBAR_LOCUS2120 [Geodia barretti]
MMGVSSISLSWRVSGDKVVGSEVVWRAISGPGGRDSSGSITSTSYTIPDLHTFSVYRVTVTRCVGSGGCDCYSSAGYGDSLFHEETPKS